MKERNLILETARNVLIEANKQVNWVNLGAVFFMLGAGGFSWGKYDGAYFRPDYKRALADAKWLAENSEKIKEAMLLFKENK